MTDAVNDHKPRDGSNPRTDPWPTEFRTARRTSLRTTHIVLPAYNEEASLPSLLHRLAALEPATGNGLMIWVVDDGSRDETAAVALRGAVGLEVKLISHQVNLGLGQAAHSGLRAVLDVASDDDVVVVMDADDTHDTGLIDLMSASIEDGADIAIASRFVAGGRDDSAPWHRRLLSRGAALVFRVCLPLDGVRDFTSGYRAYRVSLLRRAAGHWGERLIEEPGFACMVELLLKMRYCHPVIYETPLVLRYDRKKSPSKLRITSTILQYLKLAVRDRLAPPPFRGL